VDEIYFEETVEECYVKLNFGMNKETNANCYRICEISSVVDSPAAYKQTREQNIALPYDLNTRADSKYLE
jgi:Plus-3 domain